MWARRRVTSSFCLLFFLPWAVLAFGCRNCDLVEAELRTRENELREMHAELAQAEAQNEALVRELRAVRQGAGPNLTPELASQTYTLRQIVLGRGTGGYDEDNCPGDEALQVVLEPRDVDGHAIKAPGTLHVDALETSPEGIKTPLCAWDLGSDQLRRTWRSGLLSTGYTLVLPWKTWPSSTRIRVVARFTLADGRAFEADKDVTVRLTPEAQRKALPAFDSAQPVPLEPGELLPTPRKMGTKKDISSQKWWLPPPSESAGVQSASLWRPKPGPSLADAVQLLRPEPLETPPGAWEP
jgi:hypothetical protein